MHFGGFAAEKVGLESQPPYLGLNDTKIAFPLTGVNFASGGAGILGTRLIAKMHNASFVYKYPIGGIVVVPI